MKTRFILVTLAAAVSLIACNKESSSVLEGEVKIETNPYLIPVDQALGSLESFMDEAFGPDTKGGKKRIIKDVQTINANALSTKAVGEFDNLNCEELLYLVNFEGNQGYALLAADNRIREEIIAVVDDGNITEEDIIYEDPLVVTENDDISLEEYREMVGTGVLARTTSNPLGECVRYAKMEVAEDVALRQPEDNPSHSPVTYSWRVDKQVPMMLRTIWAQSAENCHVFNKYCPTVGLIFEAKAPVGCVSVALSQIVAFHEYPLNITYDGIEIDYGAIKEICKFDNLGYVGGTESSREMINRFVFNIAKLCKTRFGAIFGKAWGFAWPWNAKQALESLGYNNVSLSWGYDEAKILKSLDNGCPVFMSAISGAISGHAWVVDGYLKRSYVSSDTSSVMRKQTLVHCNWGWRGDCNGYFTSGIFKTKSAVISDEISQTNEYNFQYALNIITYDEPQK